MTRNRRLLCMGLFSIFFRMRRRPDTCIGDQGDTVSGLHTLGVVTREGG
jgi:hypothetical protein